MRNIYISTGVFIYGLLLFTIALYHQEIIGFESRFYLFALEMWRHGPTWFPTTYHRPYADYPGTGIFLIYLAAKIFGGLNKFTAVLPSAVASALTLSVTYLTGSLHGRRWGLAAVCLLLMTLTFVIEARTISLDQYTTLVTATCFYLVYSAALLGKTRRLIWIYPLFILGFAMRGPIGLVIPAGVVCIFYLLQKDIKRFLIMGFSAAGLLIVCIIILIAISNHVGGVDFVTEVLKMQVLGRLNDKTAMPWYFYLLESTGSYAITYPLVFLMLPAVNKVAPRNRRFIQLLLGWVLVIIVGLSFPADKKIRYILPIAPALALITAYLVIAPHEKKYLFYLKRFLNYFCTFFPSLCLIFLALIARRFPDLALHYSLLISFLISMQILVFVLFWVKRIKNIAALLVASFTLVITYVFIAEPINLYLNRTQDFVIKTEALRQRENMKLVFYKEGTDGLVIKYLIAMPDESEPSFISTETELKKYNSRALFVVRAEYYDQFSPEVKNSLRILGRGKIGHTPVIVFSKNVSQS